MAWLDYDGLLYFWQKIKSKLDGKVDKVTGKGLSTNDYTTGEKNKLAGLSNYTHPTSSGNKHIPAGGSAGQFLKWSADGTAVWANDNNTTYTTMTGATASADGKVWLRSLQRVSRVCICAVTAPGLHPRTLPMAMQLPVLPV